MAKFSLFSLAALAGVASAALQVDLDSPDSIKKAAALVAYDLMKYYHGNESGMTPGILPGPPPNGDYYWWEGGALWGTMIDYWHYTGDDTYNPQVTQSLLHQAGPPSNSFQHPNWTASLGNDDQGFWGMSAMLAAENKFPDPPKDQPQWLALAQGVFNTQAAPDRHDDTCGGGLRWQIPPTNVGYDYKNSIANGIFFNMAARLARYSVNETYISWVNSTWDWMENIGFIDKDYNIYDGGHIPLQCKDIDKAQYSYNAGVFIQGAAFMYNYTNGSPVWKERLDGLVSRTIEVFFSQGPMVEISCELDDRVSCKTDMLSFKGYVHRWMAQSTQLAPYTRDVIMPVLKNSTAAAVKACSGGDNGRQCGFRWTTGQSDGLYGAGQQMNVLAALSSLLVGQTNIAPPVTNTTGGTSIGDPNAGSSAVSITPLAPITGGDRAGAGILTALVLIGLLGSMGWLSTEVSESGVQSVRRFLG
ncbi:mannan endo-1,6-alpha-mannosidase DCW1-like protein [Thozetella sp. PMI_491]|nr:mannan endo-1,6-alpha-mannosidase DCW1-like protein [Thozetella sp. PMI_491]